MLRGESVGETANAAETAPGTIHVGWDPYEVWRTRVLLPRLAERATTASPALPPVVLARALPPALPPVVPARLQKARAATGATGRVQLLGSWAIVAVAFALLAYTANHDTRV